MKRRDATIEIWGGHECTVARIGDDFRSEGSETGHDARLADLELVASLGVKTVRYPALWETVAPLHPDECDWRWLDERLPRLRQLGLSPIAGLLHHGSGPRYTNLLDVKFPELLAAYAEKTAQRYPWIERYTPVNEPLTTARFSALYGHWYPHERNDRAFLRALINQCSGIRLSMRSIRRVNPQAQLVQTEDLGRIFSTERLAYQAELENERRWLSFDLLCGKVDRRHPWWESFIANGVGERELAAFLEEPCAPDVVGIDHYLTSDRFLDERLPLYPKEFHGGNQHHRYADVDAVRVDLPDGATGPAPRLREAWERYRLPVAVTEAHHGCSRDEQLRWFAEIWDAAHDLKATGVDIRAVTSWAMFGSMDWSSLLTRKRGHYEPGAFDIRSDPPRRTAVGHAVEALASGRDYDHPALDSPGWWRRDNRFFLSPSSRSLPRSSTAPRRRLLITGANGLLGQALARICRLRGLDHVALSRSRLDIADAKQVECALDELRPWAVVNAAGFVRLADAEAEYERCMRVNALGPEVLAAACAQRGVSFVTFSSDLVFNGRLGRAYVEDDEPAPACIYGRSKFQAEQRVQEMFPEALVLRTSAFFCPWDRTNFAYRVLRRLDSGLGVEASADEIVAPTYTPDLVQAALDLLIDGETGVWHLANAGEVSWHDFALRLAASANFTRRLVKPVARIERNTALGSARGMLLPSLDNAIERFFRENEHDWKAATTARGLAFPG
ncbi:MAG: dTDP-4-dehydrorhamnose reductase [Methylocystis sp.]|nr:MAG: dTDP-4-dehydrorhamnose reductase [Methylocystis sp.]